MRDHSRKVALLSALAVMTLSLGACASTATSLTDARSTPMPLTQISAPPPAGFSAFCQRLPGQCASRLQLAANVVSSAAPAAAPGFDWTQVFQANASSSDLARAAVPASPQRGAFSLTTAAWKTLTQVNQSINATIRPTGDIEAFGVADYWAMPLTEGLRPAGNCKHYVVEKRQALIEAGVPEEALSIAVAITRRGENHAVLIVATDRGDFVLDNLSPWVTPWRETGYRWIQRQQSTAATGWVALADMGPPSERSVVALSN